MEKQREQRVLASLFLPCKFPEAVHATRLFLFLFSFLAFPRAPIGECHSTLTIIAERLLQYALHTAGGADCQQPCFYEDRAGFRFWIFPPRRACCLCLPQGSALLFPGKLLFGRLSKIANLFLFDLFVPFPSHF